MPTVPSVATATRPVRRRLGTGAGTSGISFMNPGDAPAERNHCEPDETWLRGRLFRSAGQDRVRLAAAVECRPLWRRLPELQPSNFQDRSGGPPSTDCRSIRPHVVGSARGDRARRPALRLRHGPRLRCPAVPQDPVRRSDGLPAGTGHKHAAERRHDRRVRRREGERPDRAPPDHPDQRCCSSSACCWPPSRLPSGP
jgi:hypothetical protein